MLFFINQLREKSVLCSAIPKPPTGGRREVLCLHPFGRPQNRHAGNRAIRPSETARASKSLKTRFAAAFPRCEFDIIYGEGVSKEGFHSRYGRCKQNHHKRPAHGSPTAISASDRRRGKTTQFPAPTPELCKEIEKAPATLSKHPMTKPLPSARTSPIPRMNNSKATALYAVHTEKHAG